LLRIGPIINSSFPDIWRLSYKNDVAGSGFSIAEIFHFGLNRQFIPFGAVPQDHAFRCCPTGSGALTRCPVSRRLRNCEGCGSICILTPHNPLIKEVSMANHVSALKRARQTVTRSEVNRANRSRVRTSLRALREALVKGDVPAAQAQYRETVSTLDKSVQKGILHDNTVSRYKSRLNARLKALATAKA
jgi:small subunit ribosomal protein S20